MNEGGRTGGHPSGGNSGPFGSIKIKGFTVLIANHNVPCRLNSLPTWLGLMDRLDALRRKKVVGTTLQDITNQPHTRKENSPPTHDSKFRTGDQH